MFVLTFLRTTDLVQLSNPVWDYLLVWVKPCRPWGQLLFVFVYLACHFPFFRLQCKDVRAQECSANVKRKGGSTFSILCPQSPRPWLATCPGAF